MEWTDTLAPARAAVALLEFTAHVAAGQGCKPDQEIPEFKQKMAMTRHAINKLLELSPTEQRELRAWFSVHPYPQTAEWIMRKSSETD